MVQYPNRKSIYTKGNKIKIDCYLNDNNKYVKSNYQGEIIYIDSYFMILLYNINKIKIFKNGFTSFNYQDSRYLDMYLLTLIKLNGYIYQE